MNNNIVTVSPEKQPLLHIDQLEHFFGEGKNRKKILDNINLKCFPEEMIIITGPSGSGKSTLLSLIGAVRSVQKGSLIVNQQEYYQAKNKKLIKFRQNIGFIFQFHNLFDSLTAYENVQITLELTKYNRKQKKQMITEILGRLGLGDNMFQRPHTLSGGQRQRVAVARALVHSPKIILADEPTAALDEKMGNVVVNLLKEVIKNQKGVVIMVTHDHRIFNTANRIVNIIDGKLT